MQNYKLGKKVKKQSWLEEVH